METHDIDAMVPAVMLSEVPENGSALLSGKIIIQGARVVAFRPDAQSAPPRHIVLPRLTETHVHLDKCHSIDRCANVGGDLDAAIQAQARDRQNWTADDLLARMRRGADELLTAGCGTVRSHIDWATEGSTPDGPLAWHVLGAVAEEYAAKGLHIQRAALTGIDEMADTARANKVADQVALGRGVLGSFLLHHTQRRAGLLNLFRAADKRGLALDFHVDEGLSPGLDGLEMIADICRETGFQGPVLCGHACSLSSRAPADVARIADKLAQADISVVTLPTTNLYLQARSDGTPDRRGITCVHELSARGVRVVIGTDNVRDPFCPIGVHDPRASLAIAVLAAHLDPPFGAHLPKITTDANRALGLPAVFVDDAPLSGLIAFAASSLSELLSGAHKALSFPPHIIKGQE